MTLSQSSRAVAPRSGAVTAAAILMLLSGLVAPAAGQNAPAPGQPSASVNGDTVTVSWTYDLATFPDTVFAVQGTGPGGSFGPVAVGGVLSITRAQVPVGDYTVQVIAFNFLGLSPPSPSTSFTVRPTQGGPNVPTLFQPTVQGSTVTLNWAYEGPAVDGFQIEAVVQATGQGFLFSQNPDVRSLTVHNVPAGNFLVRIRAFNLAGTSNYSPQRIVVVGVVLGEGDMQVTLTWNTNADMDLHVIEPDGTHVYYANRNGRTARLDRDDTDGFGPENIFVNRGAAAEGVYQVYIVNFRGPFTSATISIRVNAGTPIERVAFFRVPRYEDRSRGTNVANVNIRTGEIIETFGDRPAITASEVLQDVKIPEPD